MRIYKVNTHVHADLTEDLRGFRWVRVAPGVRGILWVPKEKQGICHLYQHSVSHLEEDEQIQIVFYC